MANEQEGLKPDTREGESKEATSEAAKPPLPDIVAEALAGLGQEGETAQDPAAATGPFEEIAGGLQTTRPPEDARSNKGPVLRTGDTSEPYPTMAQRKAEKAVSTPPVQEQTPSPLSTETATPQLPSAEPTTPDEPRASEPAEIPSPAQLTLPETPQEPPKRPVETKVYLPDLVYNPDDIMEARVTQTNAKQAIEDASISLEAQAAVIRVAEQNPGSELAKLAKEAGLLEKPAEPTTVTPEVSPTNTPPAQQPSAEAGIASTNDAEQNYNPANPFPDEEVEIPDISTDKEETPSTRKPIERTGGEKIIDFATAARERAESAALRLKNEANLRAGRPVDTEGIARQVEIGLNRGNRATERLIEKHERAAERQRQAQESVDSIIRERTNLEQRKADFKAQFESAGREIAQLEKTIRESSKKLNPSYRGDFSGLVTPRLKTPGRPLTREEITEITNEARLKAIELAQKLEEARARKAELAQTRREQRGQLKGIDSQMELVDKDLGHEEARLRRAEGRVMRVERRLGVQPPEQAAATRQTRATESQQPQTPEAIQEPNEHRQAVEAGIRQLLPNENPTAEEIEELLKKIPPQTRGVVRSLMERERQTAGTRTETNLLLDAIMGVLTLGFDIGIPSIDAFKKAA